MKVTNISKAMQGVNGKAGRVFIRLGETKEVQFDEVGERQARRLNGVLKIETAKPKKDETGFKAEHHGGGKFNVTQGETVYLKGLSKADADAFNAMSEEDKRAYVEAEKAKA